MAKRKEPADTAADTHTKKRKTAVSKRKTHEGKSKNNPGNGIPIEKNTPKPRSSSKPARASASKTTTSTTTSKYFSSPQKAQPKANDDDDEDDFDMVPRATTAVKTDTMKTENEDDEESEEDDWEEVEELDGPLGPVEPPELVLPSHPVEIEIETPDVVHKRQRREKRKKEWETYLRRMVNRFNKDLLIDTHKVHLMCLIANGMFRNRLCNEPDLLAITLSLLPVHFSNVAKERIDLLYLSGLLKWFVSTFTLNPSLNYEENPDPRGLLERRLASLSARDHQEMTHLFLLVLRSLQLFCRLVLSLQPISLKPPPARGKGARSSSGTPGQSNPPGQKTSKDSPPSGPRVSPGTKRPAAAGEKTKGESGGKKAKRKNIKEEEDEEEVEGERSVTIGGQKPKNAKRRSVASKVSYKEESGSDGLSEGEEFQLTSAEESEDSEGGSKSLKGKRGKGKCKAKSNRSTTPQSKSGGGGSKKVKNKEEDDMWEEVEDDDDFETGGGTSKGERRKSGGRKIRGPGADEWLEVYVPKTSSWVCVDVQQGFGRPHLCSQNATAPVTYVISVDGDGHLKDLARKYDPTWMTSSKKRRVEEEWWEDTLRPFLGPEDERDRQEDKELNAKMLDKPLPTSIAEYKNHPLYSLKRHLLKYEALYPPTAAVLGYCRGEPVYSRDCVHTMHSRDTWLKEARTVRLGEEPFKMVKGFSNRSRKARIMTEQREEKDLPLFGEWQTEEYQPPIAVNGKVPRNDYGNVYLFKPCMLPVGCVHLRLPTLHRVAKKLDMDAAPAITGFDFHGGYSHAVTDGYVVCEEHEEVLRAAWLEDQEIQKKKEKEKREKRVISNWTLLVKGLLIRERLKQRYGMKNQGTGGAGTSSQTHTPAGDGADGLSSDEDEVESGVPGTKTAAETLAMAWPQNRQEEEDMNANVPSKKTTKREKKGQQKHLFPFEKV